MIEILTLKLIIDVFDNLRTYKMELNNARICIYKKRTKTFQYFTFDSYDKLYSFYYDMYSPFNLCERFGDIWMLTEFSVDTELDTSYTMSFSVYDVLNKDFIVKETSQFDNNRNDYWKVTKERQLELLKSIVKNYYTFYNELYEIYIKGIYSVCYAEPGWTEHTTILKSYRDLFFPIENKNKYSQFKMD